MVEKPAQLKRVNFLSIILLISLITIVLFPVYIVFFQYPAFTDLLKENTRDEVVQIASGLTPLITSEVNELKSGSLPDHFIHQLQELQRDSHFVKFKIFRPSGEIIYSTDADEMGKINNEDYFSEITSLRKIFTKEIEKNTFSLERQIMPADVVETYVPVMKNEKMLGVFELYYNISEERERLHSLISRSSGILFILASIMLCALGVSTVRANRYLKAMHRAEDEREHVIQELRTAIAEVKTLTGLLPICAWCKKIRDDSGYWRKVEEYVSKHSEAEFTHCICPDCRDKILDGE